LFPFIPRKREISDNFFTFDSMKNFRLLLLPFGFIYGVITAVRNLLFNLKIKEIYEIPVKSICVGNLSVGGTGKTPHVAYIAKLLNSNHNIQILSRGYGRKTKGYFLLDENSTAENVGDEPLFYHKQFKNADVAVCESRKIGVENLLKLKENQIIILDDAFQHRAVKAGLNIIITDFNQPYFNDWMLPAGNLREWISGRKRANIVIVSKCKSNLDQETKARFMQKLKFKADSIYFSSIKYGELRAFDSNSVISSVKKVLLVTGIANPTPLFEYLKENFDVELLQFPDHHAFSMDDIHAIHKKFDTFASDNKAIVTTEKDFMRLQSQNFKSLIDQKPWFYQKITVKLDKELMFKKEINNYARAI
jgi:tetraacyldisaccharide 4'-kinase